MRRKQRHHLKANPLARFVAEWRETLRRRSRMVLGLAVVLVVVLASVVGYFAWQRQQSDRAGELLADAMIVLSSNVIAQPDARTGGTPVEEWLQPEGSFPSQRAKLEEAVEKFLVVAQGYQTLAAGITARYELANALVLLNRAGEAVEHYQYVMDADDGGLHGAMARLGLAEAYVLEGNHGDAIALLNRETSLEESSVPVDAILMRLARAHELAGQDGEARAVFARVVDEFPFSVYSADARRKVDTLE